MIYGRIARDLGPARSISALNEPFMVPETSTIQLDKGYKTVKIGAAAGLTEKCTYN